jgi:hypothetical protein
LAGGIAMQENKKDFVAKIFLWGIFLMIIQHMTSQGLKTQNPEMTLEPEVNNYKIVKIGKRQWFDS